MQLQVLLVVSAAAAVTGSLMQMTVSWLCFQMSVLWSRQELALGLRTVALGMCLESKDCLVEMTDKHLYLSGKVETEWIAVV